MMFRSSRVIKKKFFPSLRVFIELMLSVVVLTAASVIGLGQTASSAPVLEPAMQQLAPQVFIDYEIDTAAGKSPRPLGIYLQGYNEPPPAENAVVKGNSDVMVIEGDTEDTGEAKDKDDKEQELTVKYEKGELSVIARKQPVIVVLYAIANELGIPLQVTNEVVDPISVNIQKSSVESALQQLNQNIRLYVRADLMTQERRPLRIVLVGQDKKS
jgi:hypothetical protein